MSLTVEPVREFICIYQRKTKKEKERIEQIVNIGKKAILTLGNKLMIIFMLVILCQNLHQYDEYIVHTMNVMISRLKTRKAQIYLL